MQMRWPLRSGTIPTLLLWGLASAAPRAALGAAITGLCPDGSVFIVRSVEQIPCARSKQVQPHEVPPLRPEYLPSPYTWKVWNEAQDPNNPYNLIDAARQVRENDVAGEAPGAGPIGAGPSREPAPEAAAQAPRLPQRPLDLGLDGEELRSLFLIVELSQENHPVQFARNTADGRGVMRVALAHSAAFEARLREVWASRGGLEGHRVLLFTAVSKRPEAFYANFTFVQRHLSYQPDATNPRQIGLLQGRLGDLEADEAVLGYIVLPAEMDLSHEIDVYWNDRRSSARFEG